MHTHACTQIHGWKLERGLWGKGSVRNLSGTREGNEGRGGEKIRPVTYFLSHYPSLDLDTHSSPTLIHCQSICPHLYLPSPHLPQFPSSQYDNNSIKTSDEVILPLLKNLQWLCKVSSVGFSHLAPACSLGFLCFSPIDLSFFYFYFITL